MLLEFLQNAVEPKGKGRDHSTMAPTRYRVGSSAKHIGLT